MKKIHLLIFIVIFQSFFLKEVLAQVADTSFSTLRHQIGFNITETLRFFERSENDIYEIYYRYKLNKKTALRTGLNYNLDTSGQGRLVIEAKFGIDTITKDYDRWKVYAGADITGGFEKFESNDRKNISAGLNPFLGIIFYVNKFFSISTEPGLALTIKHFNQPSSFNPNNKETWIEMEIINVGQLIVGLHF